MLVCKTTNTLINITKKEIFFKAIYFMSTLHILSCDTSKIALLVKTNTTIKHIYGCYCSLLISADRKML